ncbi:hypothetical protein C8A01DRAFT_40205 [Parachaetomium inaequale]|uniref:Heterokaryon incompatibility domain-containing protein n=1 Tax=Parachaetomium inaequale TaxID=2588326 RepID=A0AAN6SM05_9PEZI|nr:hypothetical protein C8A01DRAFT_40205 [Parachaetomium inaequale]
MEHLAIPRNPIRPHRTIALATKQFDDPGPFLTYAERHGALLTGSYPHVPTQLDALAGRFSAGVSSYDILDYHQGWLFFSLLAEFLGPLFHTRRYLDVVVSEDGDQGEQEIKSILLSTQHLHEDLTALRTKGPLSRIRPGDEYHRHLDACLDAAAEAFDVLESSFAGFTKLFADEMLCFASVAEALDSAVMTAVEQGPVEEMVQPRGFPAQASRGWLSKVSRLIDLDEPGLRAAMLKGGWCPGDIARIGDSFNSIAAYYYFSNFQPDPGHPDLHKDCPFYGCTLSSPVKPQHMSADCTCPGMIPFSEESLVEIYESDCIPCFTIGRTEDGSIGIALSSISLDSEAQKDPENRYIALSHVWSEGTGNPSANALPFCQLSYCQYWAMLSQQIVEKAEAADKNPYSTGINVTNKPKTQTVNLWIDTMCCPSTPGYGKNLCLAKMRDIYANAYAVLVRSAALEDMDLTPYINEPEKGVMDIAAQLYLSPWMRRMWTLQEAVLAGMLKSQLGIGQRLVLLFSGGLLSLESVVAFLKQAPPHQAALAFDMIGKFGHLTPMQYGFDDDTNIDTKSNGFLWTLSHALKYRSVTVPSDELICLATLLGVRVGSSGGAVPLVGDGQTPEEGMCELWKRIERQNKGVPGDIIFSSVPRIDVDGFRWAPRTFIQHAKYGSVYWSSSSTDDEPAGITEHGLRVKFPGVKLKPLDDAEPYGEYLLRTHRWGDQSKELGEGESEAGWRVLLVQIPAGGEDWYSIHVHQHNDVEPDSGSSRPSLQELIRVGNMALLLKQAEPSGNGLLVTTRGPTAVSQESPTSPIRVRTKSPVTIRPLARATAFISSTLHQHIGQLRAAADTAGEDDALREALVREKLTKAVSESEQLKTALLAELLSRNVTASDEQVIEHFLKIANLFAKFGGVGGTSTAADQSWLVD